MENHCCHVAGLEEKEGQELLRLDIVAAERLRTPDVNASVWLDPRDYQLRFANFVLTKVPPTLLTLRVHSSQIEFSKIIPFVPVMQMVFGESVVRGQRVPSTDRRRADAQRRGASRGVR